jgi:hypothetical protein
MHLALTDAFSWSLTMKLWFAMVAIALTATVPATAQTDYFKTWQQQPGYTDTRSNQAPIYNGPSGVGGYMTQTPSQSPTYGVPNGVGGYTTRRPGQALPYSGRQ